VPVIPGSTRAQSKSYRQTLFRATAHASVARMNSHPLNKYRKGTEAMCQSPWFVHDFS
jgi:hypothetical protein